VRTSAVVVCLVALTCGFAPRASADGEPTPANSTAPALIPVVGHNASGVSDPIGDIQIVYRDLANNPIPNALIVLDFSACTELRFCSNQHDPGVTVDCTARTLSRRSDAAGSARFRVIGWSIATPGTPGSPYNSGKIFADGSLLASPTVAIYDLDGHGLTASDLSDWLADFFSGNNAARGDYDGTGSLGASDLGTWLKAYFTNGSTVNCSPEGPCP